MSFKSAIGKTYRKLVKNWRKAQKEEELIRIEGKLFFQVKKKLENLKKEVSDKQKEESIVKTLLKSEIQLIKFLLYDLLKIRTWKLTKATIEDESLDGSLPPEHEFATRLGKEIDRLTDNLVSGSLEGELTSLQMDEEKLKELKGKRNLVLVVANEPIESFVTEEGKVYRKIEEGDILNIPKQNFRLFKRRDERLFKKIEIEEET